jgi:hypothetical protein
LKKDDWLHEFLHDYPGMSLQPTRSDETIIRGHFKFHAKGAHKEIEDTFEIEISIHKTFPTEIPKFRETAGKIPKTGDYHVNPDGTLCLGSHLRLKKTLFESPDLNSFVEKCVVPYLFNVSIKLRDGGNFVTGELAHGTMGIIHDYKEMFGLRTSAQVVYALELLGAKKRLANKRACPCGCGLRLGRCLIHRRLNAFRPAAPMSWFSKHARDVETRRFG